MLARTEPACLVIADLAGYSGYLAGVELDHAQDVLADLVDTVVGSLRPSFKLAKLEGDAAFVYLPAATVDGPALRDVIEGCYVAFQRRLRDIRQASTCECNACVRIPDLDLKFVAHHGTVARQRMAGHEELVGSDVVLVHRLLKNRVAEELDLAAYCFYTDRLLAAMGLPDPADAGMHPYRETFESVGEVAGWVSDLRAAWEEAQRRDRVYVGAEEAIATVTATIKAPPEVTWEWITSPIRRVEWTPTMTDLVEETVAGRRGAGTVNHCVHGSTTVVEEVLDWQPPRYTTRRIKLPMRGVPRIVLTTEITPVGDGSEVAFNVQKPRSVKDRLLLKTMAGQFRKDATRDLANLAPLVEADAAARAEGRATEPDVPASAGRHITEPVTGPIVYATDDPSSDPVDSGAARSSGG